MVQEKDLINTKMQEAFVRATVIKAIKIYKLPIADEILEYFDIPVKTLINKGYKHRPLSSLWEHPDVLHITNPNNLVMFNKHLNRSL